MSRKKMKKPSKAHRFVTTLQAGNKLFWVRENSKLLIAFPCGPEEVIDAASRYNLEMYVKLNRLFFAFDIPHKQANWCWIFLGTCEKEFLLTEGFYARIYLAVQAILSVRFTGKQRMVDRIRESVKRNIRLRDLAKTDLQNDFRNLKSVAREKKELSNAIDWKLLDKHDPSKKT